MYEKCRTFLRPPSMIFPPLRNTPSQILHSPRAEKKGNLVTSKVPERIHDVTYVFNARGQAAVAISPSNLKITRNKLPTVFPRNIVFVGERDSSTRCNQDTDRSVPVGSCEQVQFNFAAGTRARRAASLGKGVRSQVKRIHRDETSIAKMLQELQAAFLVAECRAFKKDFRRERNPPGWNVDD